MTTSKVETRTWFVVATNLRAWRGRRDAEISFTPTAHGGVTRASSFVRDGNVVRLEHHDAPAGEGWFAGRGLGGASWLPPTRWRVLAQTPEWGVLLVERTVVTPGGVLLYSAARRMTVEARETAGRLLGSCDSLRELSAGVFEVEHSPRVVAGARAPRAGALTRERRLVGSTAA